MVAERKTQPRQVDTQECVCTEESRITLLENSLNAITGGTLVANSKLEVVLYTLEENKRALYGYNGEMGVVGRLSRVEEIVSDVKKLMWAVLLVIVGLAVGGIWELLLR